MSRREPLKRDKARRIAIQSRDCAFAAFAVKYRAVTREHFQLGFGLSLHRANKLLRRLYDAGWLQREQQPGGELIYLPGPAALAPLADLTGEPLGALKKRTERPGFLNHSLGLTGIVLRLEAAIKESSLMNLRSAPLVERQAVDEFFVRQPGGREEHRLIRPDALFLLERDNRCWHVALEYDCSTVASGPFAQKAQGFFIWEASGALTQVHGDGNLLVLVVTGSERRIRNLQRVVKEEKMAARYLFALRSELLETPIEQLLAAPIWLHQERRVSLLGLLKGASDAEM